MIIKRTGICGSLESNDALVTINPAENGLHVSVDSIVKVQFGELIEKTVLEVLRDCNVCSADVYIQDRGALDCTIRARVETAIMRAETEGAE